MRSFTKLTAVDPGFQPDRVLTLATSLPGTGYPRGADVRTFYLRLMERVQALPGVTAASGSTALPLAIRERRAFTIENESTATRTLPHAVAHDWVLGQYFETLGIALKRGRFLSSQDHVGSEPVVVINETMARRFWPDRDPVGERIAWGGPVDHTPWMRVVGVVADVKQGALDSEIEPQTYQPWLQVSDGRLGENVLGIFRGMKISVRTAVTPLAVTSSIRDQIRALDPALPVTNVQTLQDVVDTSTGPQRFNAILLGLFALLALLLAALGVGGVLATSVSRRRQEIGVRLALGAQRGDVVRLVVRQGMVLAIAGIAIGLPASIALTRLISSLLFEVTPRDPVTFAAVTTLLIGVAAFACYLPARRATRIEPIEALRQEWRGAAGRQRLKRRGGPGMQRRSRCQQDFGDTTLGAAEAGILLPSRGSALYCAPMRGVATLVTGDVILVLRTRFREEMNCQIVHDSLHTRPGWTSTYALHLDGALAGFGSIAIAGPWKGKPTIFEFYVQHMHRGHAFDLFETFVEASGARLMEIQSNDAVLAAMLHTYARDIWSEKIVFADHLATALPANGAVSSK